MIKWKSYFGPPCKYYWNPEKIVENYIPIYIYIHMQRIKINTFLNTVRLKLNCYLYAYIYTLNTYIG